MFYMYVGIFLISEMAVSKLFILIAKIYKYI